MNTKANKRAGFTLIEMIGVLVLTSLTLVFAAMLLVTSVQVFINNLAAAEDSQKVQVAMNRLVKELTWARAGMVSTDGQSVTWTSYHPERIAAGGQVAAWDGVPGSDLLLQGTPLIDNVGAFEVSTVEVPTPAGPIIAIDITFRSARSPGVTHTTRVHPRYDQ